MANEQRADLDRQWREDPDHCAKWSAARGKHGDAFQRYLIKPFIAAYATYLEKERAQGYARDVGFTLRSKYHEILQQLAAADPGDPEDTIHSTAKAILGGMSVMDLGCGEAFLGRWLAAMGAKYVGLDYSPQLRAAAKAKAKIEGRPVLVEDCDLTKATRESLSALMQKSYGTSHPDLVTATAFLDNVADCDELMGKLGDWAVSATTRPPDLLLATLHPFYFRTLSDLEDSRRKGVRGTPPIEIHLASTGSQSLAYLRWPLEYERIFTKSGFHVLSCIHPDLGRLPPAIRNEAVKLRGDRFGKVPKGSIHVGPFVLWLLRPRTRGRNVDAAQLKKEAKSGGTLVQEIANVAGDRNGLAFRLVKFLPKTLIEHAGSLGGNCYVVLKGSAVRLDSERPAPKEGSATPKAGPTPSAVQTFPVGSLFGEFEAGDNPTSDRYKDDLAAGQEGCELLEMPLATVRELVAPPQAAAARALFSILRGRMSQYSWTWTTKFSVKGKRKSDVASDRTYDHIARAFLFGLSREAEDWAAPGPPVLVATLRELQKFIYADDASDTFKEGFPRFVSAGIVDAGIWQMRKEPDRSEAAGRVVELSNKTWAEAVRQTFDIVARPLIRDPDKLQHVLSKIATHGGSTGPIERVKLLHNNSGAFTSYAQDVRDDAKQAIQANEQEARAIAKWLTNLAAIQATIFSQAASLIFIRDEGLLRDLIKLSDGRKMLEERAHPQDDQAQSMAMSRWFEYADVTLAHIRAALAGGHFLTTAAKMGLGPDLYEEIARTAEPKTP